MGKSLEIVMLGSRGVGKTSALAAMWHVLDTEKDSEVSLRPQGDTYHMLKEKWDDVLKAVQSNQPFLGVPKENISLPGSAGFIEHKFVFKAGKKNKCDVNFVDSEGGFTTDLNPELIQKVNNALGVFFVVDAAVLMECDDQINAAMNDPCTLKQIIANVTEDDDNLQPSFIAFILTKCETYMENQKNYLFQKFNERFGFVANFIKNKGIKTYYLPLQTIGCVVFRKLAENGLPEFKRKSPEVKVEPVDAVYPLKLVFEHLIDKMAHKNNKWYIKILQWIGLKENVEKYYETLKHIAPQPQDFREL